MLDTLSFVSNPFNRLINGKPTVLIENGQFNRPHMRREMLTRDDVLEQWREQGIDDVLQVNVCYLKNDGHFNVIKQPDDNSDPPQRVSRGGQ